MQNNRSTWTEFSYFNPDYTSQPRKIVNNVQIALAFEDAMFNRRSRHLVLVLTLGYKEPYSASKTIDDISADRDHLFNNRRSNQLLSGIWDYVWKIEEGGRVSGVHMHLVIFYDGSHRADVHIAEGIGKYWDEVVTKGQGRYWNSNSRKEWFAAFGPYGDATGQVDRHNFQKRQSLRWFLEDYICKQEQPIISRINPHLRAFGTSQY